MRGFVTVVLGIGMLASSTPAQTVGIQRQLAESTPIQGRAELMPAQPGWQDWEPAPGYVGAWPEDRPATMVFSGAMQAAPETPKVVASARTAPLDCFNGEFHHQVVDLMIKSCGFPFVWGRTYSSRASFNQGLGHNWDFTYNRRIVALPGGDVSLSNGLGREDVYRESGGDFLSPRGVFDTLVQNGDTTFTQTLPSGMRLDYDSLGYLAQMTDRAGNTLTLQRNVHHNITQITDTQNRFYSVVYTDSTPAQKIRSLVDFAGREVRYSYDARGNLIRVRSPLVVGTPNGNDFASGKTTLYTYSKGYADPQANHNLLSITDPRYNVANNPSTSLPWLQLAYNEDTDRVISMRVGNDQGGPPSSPATVVGGSWTFRYLGPGSIAGAVARTKVVDPNGNVCILAYDQQRQLIRRERRTNRGIRSGEGNYVTTFTYTVEGLLQQRVQPRGNNWTFLYDEQNPQRRSQGNLLEMRQSANGIAGGGSDRVSRFTFEPVFNQLCTVTEPRAFPLGTVPLTGQGKLDLADPLVSRYSSQNLFDYQEGTGFQNSVGVPVTEQLPEGLGDLNGGTDFNAGNRIKIQLPTIATAGPNLGDSASQLHTFNAAGQPLTSTDPLGQRVDYGYFVSNGTPGDASDRECYLQSVTRDASGFALTKSFDYDLVGNVTRTVDPKGQDALFTWNELDQLVRQQSRLVGGTRHQRDYYYDANDNLITSEYSNQDENGIPFAHSLIVQNQEHNILDRAVEVRRDCSANSDPGLQQITTQYHYDGNLNRVAIESGEAVSGSQPDNNATFLYDERDLLCCQIRGDDDLDALNGGPVGSEGNFYHYDANGNLLESVDSVRQAVSSSAPVSLFSGSSGDVTLFSYDGFDRRLLETDAEGNVTARMYDESSHVLSTSVTGALDHNGSSVVLLQTDLVYDELSRLVTSDDLHFDLATSLPIGSGHSVTTFQYDLEGKVVEVTDDAGRKMQTSWDSADRKLLLTDELGNTRQYTYDANNNIVGVQVTDSSTDFGSLPNVWAGSFTFDSLDRTVQIANSGGDVRDFFYDSRSNLVKTSDAVRMAPAGPPGPQGNVVRHEYDALNRKVRTERDLTHNGRGDGSPIGMIVTSQSFDQNSRLVARTDDNGNTTSWQYDALDRLTSMQCADLTSRSFQYDADGLVSSWTDANGTTCNVSYDGLGRLLSRSVTPGTGVVGSVSESRGYDGLDRQTLVQNDDGVNPGSHSVLLKWDSHGNLLQENQGGLLVDSAWDNVGNRTQLTYPGDFIPGRRALSIGYDGLHRLRSISDSAGTIATFHFKGPRRLERRTYGPDLAANSTLYMAYDARARVMDMLHGDGMGTVIGRFQYGYDRQHHRLFEKRVHDANLGDIFQYDSVYRVTKNLQNVDLTPISAGTEIDPSSFFSLDSVDFQHDGVGNRQSMTQTQGGIPTLTSYTQMPGDAEVNQYTQVQPGVNPAVNYTYDANGNLTGDGNRTFHYDFKNRLVEVKDALTMQSIASYAHDGLDRRIEKTVAPAMVTRYLYDGIDCVEERSGGLVTRQYVWGGLNELLQQKTMSNTYYAHQNSMGSVMFLSEHLAPNSASVAERIDYDSFGNASVTPFGLPTGNEIQFQGGRLDPETGLYHMRHRMYDPQLGRFLQRDPLGSWWDDLNLGNGLAFAGNDPVNLADPMGLTSWNPLEGIWGRLKKEWKSAKRSWARTKKLTWWELMEPPNRDKLRKMGFGDKGCGDVATEMAAAQIEAMKDTAKASITLGELTGTIDPKTAESAKEVIDWVPSDLRPWYTPPDKTYPWEDGVPDPGWDPGPHKGGNGIPASPRSRHDWKDPFAPDVDPDDFDWPEVPHLDPDDIDIEDPVLDPIPGVDIPDLNPTPKNTSPTRDTAPEPEKPKDQQTDLPRDRSRLGPYLDGSGD